ncbi:hypothetical protein CPT_Marzo_254 [Stenotrophomonas phage Marzo]|nr:hypothetical protein CPT_Marzo_254 [Stenotrophomonas phage Marzo]
MRSTEAIAKYIKAQYPDATVKLEHGHIIVDMNVGPRSEIWSDAYDALTELFENDSDVRTISGCYCVGIRDVEPYFSFAFTFYKT